MDVRSTDEQAREVHAPRVQVWPCVHVHAKASSCSLRAPVDRGPLAHRVAVSTLSLMAFPSSLQLTADVL